MTTIDQAAVELAALMNEAGAETHRTTTEDGSVITIAVRKARKHKGDRTLTVNGRQVLCTRCDAVHENLTEAMTSACMNSACTEVGDDDGEMAADVAFARATSVEPVIAAGRWAFRVVALLVVSVLVMLMLGFALGWDGRVLVAGLIALAVIAAPITVALPKLVLE